MKENIKIMPFYKVTTKSGKKKVGIYVVDIPERSTLYYAETLPQAQDYIKGYKKYNTSKKTLSYISGFRDRIVDDRIFSESMII